MQEVARDTREDNVLPLKESQSAAGQTEEARTATTAPLMLHKCKPSRTTARCWYTFASIPTKLDRAEAVWDRHAKRGTILGRTAS